MRQSTTAIAIGMFLAFSCASARGETWTFVALGGVGDWDDVENWEDIDGENPLVAPGEGDTAIIPSPRVAVIGSGVDQEITTLDCDGTVVILNGRTFTIHGDSTVNGEIGGGSGGEQCFPQAGSVATLEIAASLTITGGGGKIGGGCIEKFVIKGIASPVPTLTLENESPSSVLTVQPGNGDIDISVKLVNNARVGADNKNFVVTLLTHGKSGCGDWFLTNGGKLQVDIGVKGDGTWIIQWLEAEGGAIPELEINVDCTRLTGNVTISSSLMDVNAKFCTTGDLIFEMVREASKIVVAEDESASFGGNCL